MSILVDTSVWSLGLRRHRRDLNPRETKVFYSWSDLLKQGETALIGPIRQEVLSGISAPHEFEALKLRLLSVDDLPLDHEIYEQAAEFFNACARAGLAAGHVDMTICAAAHAHHTPIFTTDPDFPRYAKVLPIRLFAA
jgi:predicted nucleic acid-binding protein